MRGIAALWPWLKYDNSACFWLHMSRLPNADLEEVHFAELAECLGREQAGDDADQDAEVMAEVMRRRWRAWVAVRDAPSPGEKQLSAALVAHAYPLWGHVWAVDS